MNEKVKEEDLKTRKGIIMMNGYNYNALNNTLTISASFAKKASKVGSPEYCVILKLRRDFPNLTIVQEEKKEGKKSITFAQMEAFIALHRNAKELKAQFEKVKKLSRIQPMPYKYVKTWFDEHFSYYTEQPTFDADGFVVDPVTMNGTQELVQEVMVANQNTDGNVVPFDKVVNG